MRPTFLLLSTLIGLSVAACGEKEPDDSGDTDADSDTDADTDTDADGDTDVAWASMSGTVIDIEGSPIEGMRLNICKQVCRTLSSDANGAYEFTEFEADWVHAFDVVDPNGAYMTPLTMLRAEEDEVRTDVTVTMLTPATVVDIPTGTAEELDLCGVHLTLKQEDLKLPFGAEGTTASCAFVPPEAWLLWDELPGAGAKAAWYLSPFDATSEDGLDFWLDNVMNLEEGATLHAYAADYDHTEWSDAGTLTVTDGKLVSDGKLHVISSLLVVEE